MGENFLDPIRLMLDTLGDENLGAEKPMDPRIAAVDTFEALFETLRSIGEITGGHKTYSPEMLISRIENVRRGKDSILAITREKGLRYKVAQLLRKEIGG